MEGEPPEHAWLREECGVREWLRRWRRSEWTRGAGRETRLASLPRALILDEKIPGGMSTPEGRSMAAAVLYFRLLPERPEPVWGGPDPGEPFAAEEWRRLSRAILGRSVAPGRGSRDRLEEALGLRGGIGARRAAGAGA
jgi:hypothetical protein